MNKPLIIIALKIPPKHHSESWQEFRIRAAKLMRETQEGLEQVNKCPVFVIWQGEMEFIGSIP